MELQRRCHSDEDSKDIAAVSNTEKRACQDEEYSQGGGRAHQQLKGHQTLKSFIILFQKKLQENFKSVSPKFY